MLSNCVLELELRARSRTGPVTGCGVGIGIHTGIGICGLERGQRRRRQDAEIDLRVGPDRVEIQVGDPRGHVDHAAGDQVELRQVDRADQAGADAAETGLRAIVEEVGAEDAGQIGLPGAAVDIAHDPGISVGLAEQKVQRAAGIDGGSLASFPRR